MCLRACVHTCACECRFLISQELEEKLRHVEEKLKEEQEKLSKEKKDVLEQTRSYKGETKALNEKISK